MPRILIVSDRDPALFVELAVADDEGGYDGVCRPPCTWTVAGTRGYATCLDEAEQLAGIHLCLDHERT